MSSPSETPSTERFKEQIRAELDRFLALLWRYEPFRGYPAAGRRVFGGVEYRF